MTLQIKKGGAYAAPLAVSVKKNGVYTAVVGVFAKVGGAYQSVLGGAVAEPPTGLLRTVAANNAVNNGTATVAGRNRICIRIPYIIGSGDLSEIVFSNYGWNLTINGFAANANAFTITQSSLENSSGTVSVPVLYSGLRLLTVAGSDNDIHSDAILPSSFGLTKFDRGSVFWLKMQIDITAGQYLPTCVSFRNTSVAGTQYLWFDNAATLITAGTGVDSPGQFATTGTAASSQTICYMPVMLGKFVSGDPQTWFGAGDSVLNSVGDTLSSPWGMGMFHRAMYSDGTPSRVVAGLNWGKPSGFIAAFRNQVTVYGWSKYCRGAIEECGLNDLGTLGTTTTTATFKAQLTQAWNNFRAQGVEKVLRTALIGRIVSTDLFVTEANQGPDIASGSIWDTVSADLNAWYTSQVGGLLDAVVPMASMHGVNPLRWKVNGTANYATTDGVHPSAALHADAAIELRSVMDTIF